MRQPLPRHAPGHRLAATTATAAVIGLAMLLGGCNQATATQGASGPAATASAGSAAPTSPAASSSASTSTLPAGQTDSDWGRIWDRLPAGFPIYPGAAPADEAQTEPVSATLAVPGHEARTIVTWMQTELERLAYRTDGFNGPLEDGSYVLDSSGSNGCRTQVSAAPLGSVTKVTIRYGAACRTP